MANDSINHIIRNGVLILESILNNRGISKEEKIDLLLKRLDNIKWDLELLKGKGNDT